MSFWFPSIKQKFYFKKHTICHTKLSNFPGYLKEIVPFWFYKFFYSLRIYLTNTISTDVNALSLLPILFAPCWYQIVSWMKERIINISLLLNHYFKCFLISSLKYLFLLYNWTWLFHAKCNTLHASLVFVFSKCKL